MRKMEFKEFIGIDISKNTLDLAWINQENEINVLQISNNPCGMKQFEKWIKQNKLSFKSVLFCLEYTGLYGLPVQHYLFEKGAFVWLEMPIQIIRSSGLQRGKNDQVDAKRIAQYAKRYQEKRRKWTPPSEEMVTIRDLMNLRDRLNSAKIMLATPIKELQFVKEKVRSKRILLACQCSLKRLESDIDVIEEQLDELVQKDPAIKQNYDLITSIKGIGKWTALTFIYVTNNFTNCFSARQLACYCGCAPFEHRSGTSVKGKTRVSKMANQNLKSLLTLCARSLIRSKNELSEYYHRKVAEGKNKMSVINALRNKLIYRIVAVIERQTPYTC